MTSETDEQFVERLASDRNGPIYEAEMARLFALARRGAAVPMEATAAMIDAGYANKDIGSPSIVYRGIWRDMLKVALGEPRDE